MMQKLRRNLKKDKRAAITDLFIFMIIGFISLIVIGLLLFGIRQVNTTFLGLTQDTGGTGSLNISNITTQTLDVVVQGMDTVKLIAFGLLFGMALSIFVTSFFVRSHPIFLIIFLLVTIIAVVVAVPISNVYEQSIIADPVVGDTFKEFTAANFVILNLPIWVSVLGLIGAALLAIVIKTKQDFADGI